MYDPKGNSKERAVEAVQFVEAEPPAHLKGIVHRFLELRTTTPLTDNYRFHALPDACTYLIFDQRNVEVAGLTRPKASSEELNLKKEFHFVNIRFLPGVWQQDSIKATYGLVDSAYRGELPLISLNAALIGQNFDVQQSIFCDFVEQLVKDNLVIKNPVTERIFLHIDDIHSVADMAEISDLSTRQLQRILKRTTGFAPHDFLKVLRLQQSIRGEPSLSYADQSHFIHAFRNATGYTPGQYSKKFDV
ncbi:MAG TPA: AraC family transcriptional regulator [Rhizobiales bacterium]|nr:AraC family transcriptional regulator [Hyphomicrobiales bacterium]